MTAQLQPLPYVGELRQLRRAGVAPRLGELWVFCGPAAWDLARTWRASAAAQAAPQPLVVLPPDADPLGCNWSPLGQWQRARREIAADLRMLDAVDRARALLDRPPLPAAVRANWALPGVGVRLMDAAPGAVGGLPGALADTIATLCLAAGCRRVRGWVAGEAEMVEWRPERVG